MNVIQWNRRYTNKHMWPQVTWSPPEQAPLYSFGMFHVEYIQQYASNTSCSTPPRACKQGAFRRSLGQKNMFIHWIFRWHLACLDKKVDIGKFLMVFNTHRTGITVDWTPKKLTEIGKKLVIFSILCIYPSICCWPLIAQGTGCLYKSWIYPCCH